MTMHNNIDIIGRSVRRNVHKPKLQTFAGKIDYQRPVGVPIAIAAHNGEGRTKRFQIEGDGRFANIAQVPNLVCLAGKMDNLWRQFVVSISDNKHAHCCRQCAP